MQRAGAFHERRVVAEGEDADLLGREPEGEVAGVVLDEEADEALVRAQRGAMDAERRLQRVVAVLVDEAELGGHGEVHLVGGDGELAADGAPHLHVDLRTVEGRLVGHLHVVDARLDQDVADHVLGLLPELRLVDELLAEAGGIVRAEAHLILLDAEDLEVFQVHLVHRAELVGELFGGAVEVRVVHVHGAHAHEAEELARLLVAVVGAVFGQPQRQVAVTARLRREDAVVVRAVHRLEVVALHQPFQLLLEFHSPVVERQCCL